MNNSASERRRTLSVLSWEERKEERMEVRIRCWEVERKVFQLMTLVKRELRPTSEAKQGYGEHEWVDQPVRSVRGSPLERPGRAV